MYEHRGDVLPADVRARLADYITRNGDWAAADRVGRSRIAILRAALGCPVNAGTRDAVDRWFRMEDA